jgi:hypothetical protein
MKMRDLERLTGVNRETIRVYFREGLLPDPDRPKPNVADYGEAHVRGIRAIRELQHGRRIPLHQIRKAMEGDASAIPSDAGAFVQLESLVAARVGLDDALVPLSSVEALNPSAEADARAFETVGAVKLTRRGGRLWLTRTDAQLVGLWGQMRAAGFREQAGFEPQVVKIYVEAARALARAEVDEFLTTIAGRADEGRAAELAQTALHVMLDFFGLLRMKAVLAEFRVQTAAAPRPRRAR